MEERIIIDFVEMEKIIVDETLKQTKEHSVEV